MTGKILLADDSVTIQKVVSLILADTEYELVSVSDGNSAIEKICETKPDMVIVDAAMPGKNGYEVCKYVKNTSSLKHIPVLLLTGTFEPINEEEAKRAGVDDSIVKPFDSQELIDKITNLFLHPKMVEDEPVTMSPTEPANLTDDWGFVDEDKGDLKASSIDDIPIIEPLEEIIEGTDAEFDADSKQETHALKETEERVKETLLQPLSPSLEPAGLEAAISSQLEYSVEKTVEEMAKKIIPDIAEKAVKKEIEKIFNVLLKTISTGT
ncbi:MAG: response regulator [Deltaproteobacteria bacterium]|nr:response regulator [Deltaproteobacteria bacterium]